MRLAQRRSGLRSRTGAAHYLAAVGLTTFLLAAGALGLAIVLFGSTPEPQVAAAPALGLDPARVEEPTAPVRVPGPTPRPTDAGLDPRPVAGRAPTVALAHARERDLYGEFRGLEQARPGFLNGLCGDVLAGDGPRAQKIALLRALQDTGAPEALGWFEHAVRTLPDVDDARGESVPAFALGLLGRAAPREPAARAALAALAFGSPELHVSLRRQAAALHAAHCELTELEALIRRLRAEPDASVVAAALTGLDGRAEDPTVRRWLLGFEDWPRPENQDR